MVKQARVNNEGKLQKKWASIKNFFLGVYAELKKVHWPDRRQLLAYTGVVLVSVTIVGFIIWLFDIGLSSLLALLFNAFA